MRAPGVDFNPQTDRLRVVSADGQNLRVNVTLGATAVDGALRYADGDSDAGKRPRIAASAYTHNVVDAPTRGSSRSTRSATSSCSRTRRTTASSRPSGRWGSTSDPWAASTS